MAALLYRLDTGEGQFVDVSMQEAAISPNMNILPMWDVCHFEFHRMGAVSYVPSTGVKQPIYFKCKDGYIMILAIGGNEPYTSSSEKLVQWMNDTGMAPQWLLRLNWWKDYNAFNLTQELADRVGAAIEKFTLTKTKDELYLEGAFSRQILIAPVSSTKDISEDIQLKARNFWVNVSHPELGESLPYCGPYIKMSETPLKYLFRAPLIGEHNRDIYLRELGISEARLQTCQDQGII
jgi:benzylsuccinate CoA-transferase BbsE subunit